TCKNDHPFVQKVQAPSVQDYCFPNSIERSRAFFTQLFTASEKLYELSASIPASVVPAGLVILSRKSLAASLVFHNISPAPITVWNITSLATARDKPSSEAASSIASTK